ncbi:trypsin-like peptidase domain-containing protein [Streptomyces sp. NPDC060048]|uniref:trypsin-like peptidase domain-containing protein n=1 Tax=unclassified Streptomyces TaxID=2593676 RepID=UPI0036B93AEC
MPAEDPDNGAGDTPGLPRAVAQVLGPDGRVAGVGFLVAAELLVTCAHVVEVAGRGPGDRVGVVFPHAEAARARQLEGEVLDGPWRAPAGADVAVVRITELPAGVGPSTALADIS